MRISDWSSDVCSSDLKRCDARQFRHRALFRSPALYSSIGEKSPAAGTISFFSPFMSTLSSEACMQAQGTEGGPDSGASGLKEELTSDAKQLGNSAQRRVEEEAEKRKGAIRSEEHTSELQSLMRISYAVFCLKKKK